MRNIVKYLATRRIKSAILKTKLIIDNEEISEELIESILQDNSISEIRSYEEVVEALNTLKVKVKSQDAKNNFRKFLKLISKSKCKMDVSENFVNVYLDELKDIEIEQLIDLLYDEFEIEEVYVNEIPQKSVFEASNEPTEESQVEEAKSEVQVEVKPGVETEVKTEAKAEVVVRPTVKALEYKTFEENLEENLKENLKKLKTSEKSYQENLSEFLTEIGMDKNDEIIFKAFEVSRNLEKITVGEVAKQVSKEIRVYQGTSIRIHKHLIKVFNLWAAQRFQGIKDKYYRASIISLIRLFAKYTPNSVEITEDLEVLENDIPTENNSTLEQKNAQEEPTMQVEETVQEESSNEETLKEFLQNKFGKALKMPDRPEGIRIYDVNILLSKIGISSKDEIIQSAFLVSANSGPETFCDLIKSIKKTLEIYKTETRIKEELIEAFDKYNLAKDFKGKEVTTEEIIMTMLNLFSKRPNKNYFTNKK